ncbi:MAG: hypothetical protein HQ522_23465 [Bacteroidetes bacterium]|nr:hypothetical protein [Bacteroidota bacterium]
MKFAEAETLFKDILTEKPEDFMVNYFYGACRTENNHFTNSDLECLIKANQEVSPININYYFGVQYHARSNWERALKFYNKYNSLASLSRNEKQQILEKIQQCYDKVNPYEEYMIEENNNEIIEVAIVNSSTNKDSIQKTEKNIPDSATIVETPIPVSRPAILESVVKDKTPTGESISFKINNEITYLYTSHFKTEQGKSLFEKGFSKQKELDFSLQRTDVLREKYKQAKTTDAKKLIGQEILTMENNLYSLKIETNKNFAQAKNLEYEYWQNARREETNEFIEEINQISKNKKNEIRSIERDKSTFIDPNILLGNNAVISLNEETTNNDLIYKIQLGAYSRGLPSYIKTLFNKLALIRNIETYRDEKGVVVYTTGNLTNYDDAIKMQNQVRQEGVEDAYVVPYFKGKRITLKEAKELEAER